MSTLQKANETQVGGAHYKGPYQHWDLVWDCDMGYFTGQITKYIARHAKKNGLQDVQKAIHFARKLVELLGDTGVPHPFSSVSSISKYLRLFTLSHPDLGAEEVLIIRTLALPHKAEDVVRMIGVMEALAGAYPSPGYTNQE